MDFYLSSRGFSQIHSDKDFTFRVCNIDIVCSRFIAAFISPRISKLLQADPTFDSYELQCNKYNENKEKIKKNILKIKNFLSGQPLHFDQNEEISTFFFDFAKDLQSQELLALFNNVIDQLENESITRENVIKRIKQKKHFNSSIEKEIEFLSSHFYDFKINDIETFSVDELSTILSSSNLRIESEDSLFQIINELIEAEERRNKKNYQKDGIYENDENMICESKTLLEFIELQYLKETKNIEKYLHYIEPCTNIKIWSSICRRISCEIAAKINNPKENVLQLIKDEKVNVFSFLSEINNNFNIVDNGIISIEPSGTASGAVSNLVDKNLDTHFKLKKNVLTGKCWIIFDFKNYSINFTKYILSVPSEKNSFSFNRPTSWEIDVSNDKIKWIKVDRKVNDDKLNGWGKVHCYECESYINSFFRYVRISPIDVSPNIDSSSYMNLSYVDFNGFIKKI